MYSTDTHALAAYLQQDSATGAQRRAVRLGPQARRAFALADEGREVILIPSVVLVELIFLNERGIIAGPLIDRLLTDLANGPENYKIVPLDLEIVRHVRDIPGTIVPEMPDRIIAATARATGTRLISRDSALRRIPGLEIVW